MARRADVSERIGIEYIPLSKVKRWRRNPKNHDLPKIMTSMRRWGFTLPLTEDATTGKIVAGHGRLEALLGMYEAGEDPPSRIRVENGRWLVPVLRGVSFKSEAEAEAYLLADNRLVELGGWDVDLVETMLPDIPSDLYDMMNLQPGSVAEILGMGNDEKPERTEYTGPGLVAQFVAPPFSVLDTRQGYWQTRKKAWLSLGIRGEEGRGRSVCPSGAPMPATPYMKYKDGTSSRGDSRGRPLKRKNGKPFGCVSAHEERKGFGLDYDTGKGESAWGGSSTSIFDPVLCELLYRWFSPAGGQVIDPFAGGSVRGIVAAALGRRYTGIELQTVQVAANRTQWEEIGPKLGPLVSAMTDTVQEDAKEEVK